MDLRAAAVMERSNHLRVATYNIHKCRGFDRKTSPERILDVIRELDADILCLQEVVNAPDGPRLFDQAGEIARALPGYVWCFGDNRPLRGGTYGNMTLTRLPLRGWRNHDLSWRRERRGVLQAEIEIGSNETLHVFNVHLGTSFMERRYQARRLVSTEVLAQSELRGPRLVIGDFNEWTRGLTTKLMRSGFQSFRPEHALRFPRTFPGMLPVLTLDHCYYEPPLELEETGLWRSSRALIASDHLPLIANFRVGEER
ncbi:MAG TPA: endonuclease/exonuclease/phosphatase family protein [Acidobacteriaceae bacterium]